MTTEKMLDVIQRERAEAKRTLAQQLARLELVADHALKLCERLTKERDDALRRLRDLERRAVQ